MLCAVTNTHALQALSVLRERVQKQQRLDDFKEHTSLSSSGMRMVAVSATLPNVQDIATFLEAPPECTFFFGPEFRPVPLKVIVKGCGRNSNEFFFDKSLSNFVPPIIDEHSNGKPAIVFCHTKKDTQFLALSLGRRDRGYVTASNKGLLRRAASSVSDRSLQNCLQVGSAFHHAGLSAPDRKIVEDLFLSTQLRVLCATSTLAMGINLPAHLVVIKRTRCWRGGGSGHQDLDAGTLTQMTGRAGRPGLDTSGVAVIMTDNDSTKKFDQKLSGSVIVESHLCNRLVETMNAEISQGVVTDIPNALAWLESTFLYIRMQKRPQHYKVPEGGQAPQLILKQLKKLCMDALKSLTELDIIRMTDDIDVAPNAGSKIMARHMVPIQTIERFVNLEFDGFDLRRLIHVLSQCEEMHAPLRRDEKKVRTCESV